MKGALWKRDFSGKGPGAGEESRAENEVAVAEVDPEVMADDEKGDLGGGPGQQSAFFHLRTVDWDLLKPGSGWASGGGIKPGEVLPGILESSGLVLCSEDESSGKGPGPRLINLAAGVVAFVAPAAPTGILEELEPVECWLGEREIRGKDAEGEGQGEGGIGIEGVNDFGGGGRIGNSPGISLDEEGWVPITVPPLEEATLMNEGKPGMVEQGLEDPVRFFEPDLTLFGDTEIPGKGRGLAEAENQVDLVGQFIAIGKGALPEFPSVMDHAGLVAEDGLEGSFDEGTDFIPVALYQRGIASPVPVRAKEVEHFPHLVELLEVGVFEDAGDHGRPGGIHHILEDTLDGPPAEGGVAKVEGTEGGISGVADPLASILENTGIHGAILGDHPGKAGCDLEGEGFNERIPALDLEGGGGTVWLGWKRKMNSRGGGLLEDSPGQMQGRGFPWLERWRE